MIPAGEAAGAIAYYCASRSIVRRYSKSQPALFRLAATLIFSDFSPFTGFSANRRSVDMFSAACPTLITLQSFPNGAPASGEDRSQLPNAPGQPPESDPPEPADSL